MTEENKDPHAGYQKYMLVKMIRKCCHASDLISELQEMDHQYQIAVEGRENCAWQTYDLEELSNMNDSTRDL